MKPRNAFTLVEIVVVIGIVMILYAIISPAIFSARLRARETQCASNMHQCWLALQMYRGDYGAMPTNAVGQMVPTYIRTPSILICPSEYRNLRAISPDPDDLSHEPVSSYAWPCCAQEITAGVYARRGEQTPCIMCDVHTHISSGAPFFQVIRFDGSLSHVPANKLQQDGDSWGF